MISYIIIIIPYIYVVLFWALKALYIEGGGSPQPPPVCSIHLDDETAAILRQNAHHTPAYWWRGVMKPISVWGWLRGYDEGQRPMGKFDQDAGVRPNSFSKDILGFLMTTERQDLGLTSYPKDGACCYLVSWHLCTWVHFLTRQEIRTNNYILLQFPKETNTRGSKTLTPFTPFHTNLQSFD